MDDDRPEGGRDERKKDPPREPTKPLPKDLDLSFLGYERPLARPMTRRPTGKFVPPPPSDPADLKRTHFRIPATKRDAERDQG